MCLRPTACWTRSSATVSPCRLSLLSSYCTCQNRCPPSERKKWTVWDPSLASALLGHLLGALPVNQSLSHSRFLSKGTASPATLLLPTGWVSPTAGPHCVVVYHPQQSDCWNSSSQSCTSTSRMRKCSPVFMHPSGFPLCLPTVFHSRLVSNTAPLSPPGRAYSPPL